jgi:hypothetical protein
MLSLLPAIDNEAGLIADLSRRTFFETFAAFNSNIDMDTFMEKQFTRNILIQEVLDPTNIFFLAIDDKSQSVIFL